MFKELPDPGVFLGVLLSARTHAKDKVTIGIVSTFASVNHAALPLNRILHELAFVSKPLQYLDGFCHCSSSVKVFLAVRRYYNYTILSASVNSKSRQASKIASLLSSMYARI